MTAKHTPGPWTISWYNCTMDKEDVEHAKSKGNMNAKVGDVLWRAPRSIGPCGSEHSHWGGDLLTVEEADARLIAAAPDLLEALESAWLWMENQADGQSKGGHATFDLLMLREQRDIARAAIAKATGEQA